MKNISAIILFSIILFFNSCEKEDLEVNPIQTNKESNTNYIKSEFTDFIAPDGKTYLITKYDLKQINEKLRSGKIDVSFTTMTSKTVNAQLEQIFTNKQVHVSGHYYYPTANYLCDVFKSHATITVPSGSYALFNTDTGASKKGLASYSNTENEGTIATQSGNKYT